MKSPLRRILTTLLATYRHSQATDRPRRDLPGRPPVTTQTLSLRSSFAALISFRLSLPLTRDELRKCDERTWTRRMEVDSDV